MSGLPKITHITRETKLPSTGGKIKFRPYTVREQKLFLLMEGEPRHAEVHRAMSDMVQACVVHPKNFDVEKLPFYDTLYLFIQIRGLSVGEVQEIIMECEDDAEYDEEGRPRKAGTQVEIPLDFTKIKVVFPENSQKFNYEIGSPPQYLLTLRHPTLNEMGTIQDLAVAAEEKEYGQGMDEDGENSPLDEVLGIVALLMTQLTSVGEDSEEGWDIGEFTLEDRLEWMDNLEQRDVESLTAFVTSLPYLSYTVRWVNPNTKKEFTKEVREIGDFFG